MDDAGRWMTDSRSAAVQVAFKVPTASVRYLSVPRAVRLKRSQSPRQTLEARLVCLGRCGARGVIDGAKRGSRCTHCEMLHKPDERHR
jgi:hypothetical protein